MQQPIIFIHKKILQFAQKKYINKIEREKKERVIKF